MRRRKLGNLCWLATVSSPDICARIAGLATRVNSLPESGIYRFSDLIEAVDKWPKATSAFPGDMVPRSSPAGREVRQIGARGGEAHYSTTTLPGGSDAAMRLVAILASKWNLPLVTMAPKIYPQIG